MSSNLYIYRNIFRNYRPTFNFYYPTSEFFDIHLSKSKKELHTKLFFIKDTVSPLIKDSDTVC